MNAMSVSPVKPPLNPGNLAVPTVPTNLSKTPLPSGNNYAPLNLMPEGKPIAPVSITPSTPEKSMDLCSKPPLPAPTSNGTVFPIPESNQNAVVSNAQNCVENYETAENLSTTNVPAKPEITPIEPPKIKNDVEEKKVDAKKAIPPVNDTSVNVKVIEKEPSAQTVTANTVATAVENIPAKAEEKKEPGVASSADNVQNNLVATPPKKEPVPETTKVEPSPKKESTPSTPSKHIAPSSTTSPEGKVPEAKADIKSDKTDAVEETKSAAPAKSTPPKTTKRKAKAPVEAAEDDAADGRKSKRTRLPTQPYQSPIPELQLIAKLETPAKTTPKNPSEKIIAFYKGEFLAVRNPEGSFYICQAFQNIYRSSSKIKIRWLTNLPQNIYTPDFYDTTEFDCILTNVSMPRVEKDRWKLPDHELTRIENILKRALDVEKGVAEQPSVTEEHPDGLDLSLYKDEAQLQKKKKKPASPKKIKSPVQKKPAAKAVKKPKAEKPAAATSPAGTKKSARLSSYLSTTKEAPEPKAAKAADKQAKVDKKDKKKNKSKVSKKAATATVPAAAAKQSEKTSSKTWEPSVKASNSSRVVLSLRKEDTSAKSSPTAEPKATKRTSSVSLKASAAAAAAATPPPSKRRKDEAKSTTSNQPATSDRPGKVRNAGSAVAAKINSAAMRTTKDKERKTSAPSNQRKK